MNVTEIVLNKVQKRKNINLEQDWGNINYIDEGLVDSMGFIEFISELEDEFDIEFSDEEIMSTEILTIKGIIDISKRKCS